MPTLSAALLWPPPSSPVVSTSGCGARLCGSGSAGGGKTCGELQVVVMVVLVLEVLGVVVLLSEVVAVVVVVAGEGHFSGLHSVLSNCLFSSEEHSSPSPCGVTVLGEVFSRFVAVLVSGVARRVEADGCGETVAGTALRGFSGVLLQLHTSGISQVTSTFSSL